MDKKDARAVPDLLKRWPQEKYEKNAILKCKELATNNRGYPVFALQQNDGYTECRGGWDDNKHWKYGQSDECNHKGTGGSLANQVYRIKTKRKRMWNNSILKFIAFLMYLIWNAYID